ncbi:MarR family transcriptional regulator [Rhizobium sp. Root1220]|uniref:MarR family winged helix-turn-helix transcriptional regulator n=1 Tax=Rhizobium sp. Root1220 TaxID=1736432 RepID=UPI0006F73276|nr:MarR family transcriptional regulator [Rhizobium sp. Root1220]KQV65112.1 MarR family transcriptional regulator [Rhizobium sp. Root1220]
MVPVSDLTSHLGYWLRYVSNHVSHEFARKLEERGVTVAEWVLLRGLYDIKPASPSHVAERLGMTRGAISKLADRLIDKRLVERRANPDDARAQTLSLTQGGRALVPELASLADKNDSEFFGHLSLGERQLIQRILEDVVKRRDLKAIPTS